MNSQSLAIEIRNHAKQLGFDYFGITDTNTKPHDQHLQNWLNKGYAGDMSYMSQHGAKRYKPDELVPETVSVICVGIHYLPPNTRFVNTLKNPFRGYISRYALGRDYHKVIKTKLKKLAQFIESKTEYFSYRAFVDSAPVLEKALAEKAGIGWIGKHTNLINPKGGSWFFLGELYTNIPFDKENQKNTFTKELRDPSTPLRFVQNDIKNHCGSCQACIDICPTKAIVAPYQLDARRCISYLTIEYKGSIPVELRSLMGNRIYGCDDCQLVCPWNKFAHITFEKDFSIRKPLDGDLLVHFFQWDEETLSKNTEGSAMRRINHEQWLRNIAVALGNAPYSNEIAHVLQSRLNHPSELVREHIDWAMKQQLGKKHNELISKSNVSG